MSEEIAHQQKKKTSGAVAAICALIGGASFGVGSAFSQIVAAHGFTVMQICFSQFLCAFVISGILVLVKYRPHMTKKDAIQLLILGLFSSFSSYSYYLAIAYLSVAAGVAIQFQYVWIAVVIQCVVEHTLPRKWTVVSAVLIIIGTIFGSGMADEIIAGGMTMDPMGLMFALICAVTYAIFIYANGRVAVKHPPMTRTFFEVCGGFVMCTVLLMFNGGFAFDVLGSLPWGVLMGTIMSVLPVVLIVTASTRLEGGLVAILTSSELPMAVIAGFLLLGQQVTPLIVFGVLVILGAIALSQLDNKAETKPEVEPEALEGEVEPAETPAR